MTAFRMLGAFCLFESGCVLGWKMAGRLKRRFESLEAMQRFLERLCVSICYVAPPMEEIVRELAADASFPVVSDCLVRLEQGEPFPNAFADALRMNAAALALTEEDVTLMLRTVERLGRTDAAGQASLLQLGVSELKPRIASAAENVQRRGRLYRSLGVLGGLACVVLLL